MSKCPLCTSDRLIPATILEQLEIGGVSYKADVPCTHCEGCGEDFIPAASLATFERAVAEDLTRRAPSGKGLRFVRKELGLPARELAQLLDVTPETVSHWENDKTPVPRAVWGLVGQLHEEHLANRHTILERLQGLRTPAPAPAEVRLSLPAFAA